MMTMTMTMTMIVKGCDGWHWAEVCRLHYRIGHPAARAHKGDSI